MRLQSCGSNAGYLAALFATLLIPAVVAAQTRALTDADAKKVASLLAIEAQGKVLGEANQVESDRVIAATYADGQAVIAGKRDPWEVLQGYRKALVAPPDGMYSASCSKVLTKEVGGVGVRAIFSFGIPADELGRRAMKGDSAAVATMMQENLSPVEVNRSAAGQRVENAMVSVHEFYTARGYVPPPRLGGRAFAWYLVTEGVRLEMYPVNPYHTEPGCMSLGDGPVLVAIAGPETPAADRTWDAAMAVGDRFAAVLDSFGWTREEYHELRALVNMAHDDAHATEPLESAAGGDAMLLEFLKESFVQRRKNAAVYRRHAVLLDPLIAATRVSIP